VLNLFAYTGSFTVYAAAGGAARTLTIDLSNTYLEWARRNLEINSLQGPRHEFLRADVKTWLKEPPAEKFDLIVLDPPTFSNSKAMRNLLDVQLDHTYLINDCLRRLQPGGVLYFSTNFRKFRLEPESIRSRNIRDITAQTIPNDFRNKRIHYCWEIRH
jgi:23S rRNA (cytosine1962-C5)-methyltransferase